MRNGIRAFVGIYCSFAWLAACLNKVLLLSVCGIEGKEKVIMSKKVP
jgi:hypothetical protein